MKIYTRHGDEGLTSLTREKEVFKDDIRIEANGMLDELNASLGVVKTSLRPSAEWQRIEAIQNMIARVMGVVAGAAMDSSEPLEMLTRQLEEDIDAMQTDGKFCFVVPGETLLNAWIHVARTKCRTAERRLWTMHQQYPLNTAVMKFINRLSDYLFVLALNV